MTSQTQMKEYFQRMAAGKIKPSDISYINQRGRGLNNYRHKKLKYRLNQIGRSSTVVSPVEQNIMQAAKKSAIKRKADSTSDHLKKKRRTSKKTKKPRKKSKKTKKKATHKKQKRASKSKIGHKKRKDIFSKKK